MGARGSRRQLLFGAGASLTAAALPAFARSQPLGLNPGGPTQIGKLLGPALPPELRALLPGEAFQAAEFVSALMDLEAQAKVAKLPQTPLSRGDAPLPARLDRLYELAMPRLVALIDRAETRSPALAERGGELLAKLHATQFVAPAWLAPFGQPGGDPGRLAIDPGSEAAAAVALPQPDQPPVLTEPEEAKEEAKPAPVRIGRSLRFGDLADEYAAMFKAAEIRSEHANSARWHLTMMRQSRPRYDGIARRTGVPWYFIATLHALEASFNFRAHLHNGDYPLSQRTRQVPAGRPSVWLPPSDWDGSAIDALRLMGFAGASDWSLPRLLYRIEAYNGFGYRRMGRASPYLWSFSTHYSRGKFVADGRFNPNARSQQCGAAVMLKVLDQAGEVQLA